MTSKPSLRTLLELNDIKALSEMTLPGRSATFSPVPEHLVAPVRRGLGERHPGGLYAHQAEALGALGEGLDVCLATPTASGKSLVFQTHAAHKLLTDPRARVIAVYPSRALIADQLASWQGFLAPLGQKAAVIDGGIPVAERAALVRSARVLLMTPDVMHAWLLGRAQEDGPRTALRQLSLLILDEAHVYDGAFGTNVSYFMRRLQSLARPFQLLVSTATVGEPQAFLERLTGRQVTLIGGERDGSEAPAKRIVLAEAADGNKGFEARVRLIQALADGNHGRFLVFGDSRVLVEKLTAAVLRKEQDSEEEEPPTGPAGVLPYRAGYEEEDRTAIQRALEAGELSGVICTSALELGIDIGAIETVVLLSVPPSRKSFWQRVGRAGRRSTPGLCVLFDDEKMIERTRGGLKAYLAQPIEPNRLYLDNRYIQYAHALCAAQEAAVASTRAPFDTLPPRFLELLDNELTPRQPLPPDLYPLKQRAQDCPHLEFPLRNATERDFEIASGQQRLGRVSQSQMLREAYPGAIYLYMARSFRVVRVDQRKGKIECRRQGGRSTRPTAQTVVFPRFRDGLLRLLRGPRGFVAEAEVQVSERVTGFVEKQGRTSTPHAYGPESSYARAAVTNFVQTTGVCWRTEDEVPSMRVAERLREAFCRRFGIQEQDIGFGSFHAQSSPSGGGVCRGLCVYDATSGSLRLTELLALHFQEVLEDARTLAEQRDEEEIARELAALAEQTADCEEQELTASSEPTASTGGNVVEAVAPGQHALYLGGAAPEEVTVINLRYTPQGLFYEVQPPTNDGKRMVAAMHVQPLAGQTEMLSWDLLEWAEIPGSRHVA